MRSNTLPSVRIIRYLVPVAGLLIALLTTGAQAALVSYQDGDFADGDWNIWASFWGSASGTSTQVSSGGLPGAYRQIDLSAYAPLFSSSNISLYHTNLAFSYDPSASGAITGVDLSFDSKLLSGSNSAILLYAEQNGEQFIHSDASGFKVYNYTTTNWTTTAFTGLTETDFRGASGTPDFSDLGNPVNFGFYVYNGVGSGTMSSSIALDNWSVNVTNVAPVPVPAAFWLMASGLIGMAAVARRRTS